MRLESILLTLANLHIDGLLEKSERLGLVLVINDLLKFHQLPLVEGDGGFFRFQCCSSSWLACYVADACRSLHRKRKIPLLEPQGHIHQAD